MSSKSDTSAQSSRDDTAVGKRDKYRKRFPKYFQFIVRAIISIGLIIFLVHRADVNKLLSTLISADMKLFVFAVILGCVKIGIESYKLYLLLWAKRVPVPFWVVIKIMVTSTFLGTFTPTSLGMEIFRAYGFSKYTDDKVESISAVAINRFMGLLTLFVMASVSALWESSYAKDVGVVWIVLLFGIPIFLVSFGFSNRVRKFFGDKIFRYSRFTVRLTAWIRNIGASFYDYWDHKKILGLVFLLSFLFQGVRILACFIMAVALGVNVPLGFFFIFIPLVLIFTMLPFSVGGIGMREGGVVYFMGRVGVDPARALGVSILWFIAAIASASPGLFFYLKEGIGPRKRRSRT